MSLKKHVDKNLPAYVEITGWVKPVKGIVDMEFRRNVRSDMTKTNSVYSTYTIDKFEEIEIKPDNSALKFNLLVRPKSSKDFSFTQRAKSQGFATSTFLYMLLYDLSMIAEEFKVEDWYDTDVTYPSYVKYVDYGKEFRCDMKSNWVNGVMMAAMMFDDLNKYDQPYIEMAIRVPSSSILSL